MKLSNKISANIKAWHKYCGTFRRSPTFLEYVEYLNSSAAHDWSVGNCTTPSFEDYLAYLIERDAAEFDWMDTCGHVPTLPEYMVYQGS